MPCRPAVVAIVAGGSVDCSEMLAPRRSTTRDDSEEPREITIRGPLTYAGPGSLGGTESALRR